MLPITDGPAFNPIEIGPFGKAFDDDEKPEKHAAA